MNGDKLHRVIFHRICRPFMRCSRACKPWTTAPGIEKRLALVPRIVWFQPDKGARKLPLKNDRLEPDKFCEMPYSSRSNCCGMFGSGRTKNGKTASKTSFQGGFLQENVRFSRLGVSAKEIADRTGAGRPAMNEPGTSEPPLSAPRLHWNINDPLPALAAVSKTLCLRTAELEAGS